MAAALHYGAHAPFKTPHVSWGSLTPCTCSVFSTGEAVVLLTCKSCFLFEPLWVLFASEPAGLDVKRFFSFSSHGAPEVEQLQSEKCSSSLTSGPRLLPAVHSAGLGAVGFVLLPLPSGSSLGCAVGRGDSHVTRRPPCFPESLIKSRARELPRSPPALLLWRCRREVGRQPHPNEHLGRTEPPRSPRATQVSPRG